MIFRVLTISLGLIISGCAVVESHNDMDDNLYLKVDPIEVEFSGIYTGVINRFISTYVLSDDGNGVICGQYDGRPILGRIKVYEHVDGAYLTVAETGIRYSFRQDSSGNLSLEAYGETIELKPDKDLVHANLGCKKEIEQMLDG
jgi:hypothetical protein